eukprot:Gb_28124 [translate_table: standard]
MYFVAMIVGAAGIPTNSVLSSLSAPAASSSSSLSRLRPPAEEEVPTMSSRTKNLVESYQESTFAQVPPMPTSLSEAIRSRHGALLPVWQRPACISAKYHSEDMRLKWSLKGLGGAEYTFFTQLFVKEKVLFKALLGASVVGIGHFSCLWFGVTFDGLISMGGDPVITESSVLSMEEDVRVILDDSGLLPFFKKFTGHSLITKVTGLPNDGETVSRDKMDQQESRFLNRGIEWLSRYGSPVGLSRGAANRISGVPITKSQHLIGPAPPSLHLTSVDSKSDAEDDSKSQGMVSPVTNPKEKEGKKRKLSDNLAKSSRRSTRLQRKSAGKSNVIVNAGSSEEEQKTDTAQGKVGRSSPSKGAAATPLEKGEGSPDDSQHPSEDLLGHLRILNSLSGTLTSACACLNLLIVEITKYLKEAAKGKKD